MSQKLSPSAKWSLVEYLYLLIGQNWNPAEALSPAEMSEQAGRPVQDVLLLFTRCLCDLLSKIRFKTPAAEKSEIDRLRVEYLQRSNAERWDILRELLCEISAQWDDEEVDQYEHELSFDEAIYKAAGLRFFR